MKVLELFKGTGSISTYFAETEHEVTSLDILAKFEPDICCDIMDWNYQALPKKSFDIIWASPECKIFSQLQNTNIGENRKWKSKEELKLQRDIHSKFIKRTIEIIRYFEPEFYFIENPLYSKIWDYVDDDFKDKFVIADYCYFGYRYKKPTKILTNKILENKRCSCKKHGMRIGVVGGSINNGSSDDTTTLQERYSIPPLLLNYLFE